MTTWAKKLTGHTKAGRGAFTLVEVILTIMVVGVGLVASMRALPVVLQVSRETRQGLEAQALATDLLTEIALLPFEDPGEQVKFGPEDDEVTSTRADFDDVDDYDGWTASPPQDKGGNEKTEYAQYRRSVDVAFLDVSDWDPRLPKGPCPDVKLITITVSRQGMSPVTLTTVRLRGANREDLH